MTKGVGGLNTAQALDQLHDMTQDITPISVSEYRQRLHNVQRLMKDRGIDALFTPPGSNLLYFTGINWRCSERLTGVVISAQGELAYIIPHFELDSFQKYIHLPGEIITWQEHENPFERVISKINNEDFVKKSLLSDTTNLNIALCGSCPFTFVNQFVNCHDEINFICADEITQALRQIKSPAELALIKRAMEMTLVVQKAAASILYEGISSKEVVDFIDKAHKKVGASGSYFCLVLFAEASALPHGIKGWQALKANDMVLIDTGCKLMGYTSDITRSYVFGMPNQVQREVWQAEKETQAAAFNAAQVANSCEYVDQWARKKLAEYGFSQGYTLPGLPHRTGHGIGLDIHESPYLVGGDKTALTPGMCFSNEPTICIPGEFGVRLEDHFYISDTGPKWFTSPSPSIDDPFGLDD